MSRHQSTFGGVHHPVTSNQGHGLRHVRDRAGYDHTPATGAGCMVIAATALAMILAVLTGVTL